MTRLVTQADGNPAHDGVSVALRHELELTGGYRVLLLDDRGWGSSGTWDTVTVAEVQRTARCCVGPDEPFDDHTPDTMAAEHWATLAGHAARGGVRIEADTLARLPHEVILSPRLLARLSR